ncbi:hypothetical protein [Wenzhouxiangella limi]|uniref:Uncharacterized protein n=1 Tax=Wenzhouxiangella limi TaxID=2707351 RepID=A0A845VCB2_9GAMM|nr:hypothetical protein [Wenzhouxiangella limi]NDY94909.1 hypothetical protein [Wenzhouxiangella limi]
MTKIATITGHEKVGFLGYCGCQDGNVLGRQSLGSSGGQMLSAWLGTDGNIAQQILENLPALRALTGQVSTRLFDGKPGPMGENMLST